MNYKLTFTIILIIFLASSIACTVSGETKQLKIYPFNADTLAQITEVYEKERFGIYVEDPNDPSALITNITITFNGQTYHIRDTDPDYPFLYLAAPEVDKDTEMYITANKEGYETAQQQIIILNRNQLQISPTALTVKCGDNIKIIVTDEHNNPISGVEVTLTLKGGKDYSTITDAHGVAEFLAPSVNKDTTIFITASKESYEPVSIKGKIQAASNGLITNLPLLPIIGAAVFALFIFAGVIKYVHKDDKEFDETEPKYSIEKHNPPQDTKTSNHSYHTTKTSSAHQIPKHMSEIDKTKVTPNQAEERSGLRRKGVRIEEIVIGKPETPLTKTEPKPNKVNEEKFINITKKKASPNEWVVGEDSVRLKIDEKIGGTSPKKDINRWLTGTEDIVAKVDEKLKKYNKKKEKNNK